MARNLNRFYGSAPESQGCGCNANMQGGANALSGSASVLSSSSVSSAFWNSKMVPGMAYVPAQRWEDVYDAAVGLQRGTIFEALDKPFMGRMEVCCR